MIDIKKLADPEFFGENKLPAHSDHRFIFDGKKASKTSLNGVWKFKYARNPEEVTGGFFAEDYDCSAWEDIRVPAHIQLEGYDKPQYVNVQYPFDGCEDVDPGEVPTQFNPVGSYVKYIELDPSKDDTFILSFEGVESSFALWVNSEYVGYSEGSFLPAEFDVSNFVKKGVNKIALAVFKWSSSSWAEDQDFFRFSGIFRDVNLYKYSESFVTDIKVVSELSGDYSKADVKVTALSTGKVTGKLEIVKIGRTDIGLVHDDYPAYFATDEEGEVIYSREVELKEGENVFDVSVDEPLLWSAEAPNLYKLRLCENETLFGIRKFEIVDGVMHLNGKRIVFKGVNRHEFSGVTGRVPNLSELWTDIVTMKRHNINAIRTCHYPDNSPIYELCDRLGLYMISETDLETHGIWVQVLYGAKDYSYAVPGDNPAWKNVILDRAERMYERDKNHPAILFWSCGNEAFGGTNLKAMSDYFHSVDKTRLVHYEGVFNDRHVADISDVESQMYTPTEGVKAFLEKDRSKPFIMCEYMHAMGNSCGDMKKYTDLTETEMQFQGGFIWDYIDQSLNATDRYGVKFQKYGGDFDDRPSDYQFSGNGIVYGGSRLPSPKMQDVKYNYRNFKLDFDFTGVVSKTVGAQGEENFANLIIKNNSLFTDASEYECFVTVSKDGVRVAEKSVEVSVLPGEEKRFESVVKIPVTDGEITVTASLRTKKTYVWAERGHEVSFGQVVYPKSERKAYIKAFTSEIVSGKGANVSRPDALQLIYSPNNFGVKGEHFTAIFNYGDAGMQSYTYGGKELFKAAPKPNFWRAPIDNDCGNQMQMRYAQWKIASMYQKALPGNKDQRNPLVTEKADCVEVAYDLKLATTPESFAKLVYTVYGNGAVKVNLSMDPVKELGDMPEFGVMFKVDADYDRLEWYGRGPEECYSDRQEGARLGFFKGLVKDQMSAYMIPQECGNHTDVRFAKVVDEKGRGLIFEGLSENGMSFSALPYSPHEMENAMHPNELPPVHFTYVRAAMAQMGVGGDDSWGARVHPEFLLDVSKKLSFEFAFKGI